MIAILCLCWFGIRDCDIIISTCYENLQLFEIRLVNHIHVAHSRMGRKTVIEIKKKAAKFDECQENYRGTAPDKQTFRA